MNIYYIDLFCGAGGTSTGIHLANKNTKVLACVNHDANAIKSHQENHPEATHFTEDVRDLEVVKKLKTLVENLRQKEPTALIALWASLECTNFSKAKGGQERDADSRSLAEHMGIYIEVLNPDFFFVENVREFMSWGPLDQNGKPVSRQKGEDYTRWIDEIKQYGYSFDYKLMNSANYGAYQSRERLFLQFSKARFRVVWPVQTHIKAKDYKKESHLIKWSPVREVLDLDDEGISIFNRKKPLSENTLKRIYAGLIKFVPNGQTAFTAAYNSGNDANRCKSLNEPVGTITTNNSHAVVNSVFIKKYFSGRPEGKVIGIDAPCGTITTVGGQAIVTANHLNTYYGNSGLHSIENPSPTITTKDRVAKVAVNFIDQQYGNSKPVSIEQPCNSITTVPKFALVNTNFILNPAWGGNNGSIEKPCCTVVARQDKAPLYMVSAKTGIVEIQVYEDDSETMVKIKTFMVNHQIIDIKMRMLKIVELKQIQGFPKDYKLIGTQTQQKKYIGNAVEVGQAKALVNAHYNAIFNDLKQTV